MVRMWKCCQPEWLRERVVNEMKVAVNKYYV